jgi:hypothetical protein
MTSLSAVLRHIYPGISIGPVGEGDCSILQQSDGVHVIAHWNRPEPQPTQQELDAAVLPATKAARIAAINAECRARLLARYGPAEEQVSRTIGVYGAQEQSDMQAGIAATIDASNTASNAVLAAADIAAVEAVTVTWPAI